MGRVVPVNAIGDKKERGKKRVPVRRVDEIRFFANETRRSRSADVKVSSLVLSSS